MGARRVLRHFGALASDLTLCGYLHMTNLISHLENIDVADEISCADIFLVDFPWVGGYVGGLEALKIFQRIL